MAPPKKIGLDLDNTIIDYGPAIPILARSLGLRDHLRDRESIRTALKTTTGDREWREFQSVLYTRGLDYAVPAVGLARFLDLCRERSVELTIVSHKTALTPSEFGGRSLRSPAIAWLQREGITPEYVAVDAVFYCSTRDEKLRRIVELGLDVFVDDLPEVLNDLQMPPSVRCFLYQASDRLEATPANPGDEPNGVDFAYLIGWLERC